jgi:nicotinamide riboside kinase
MAEIERIVVYGPESTGKSVLTESLAKHFNEPWSREFVRQFWDDHNGVITDGDLKAIGQGQRAGEDEATAQAKQLVFCDTDLLTCRIWGDLLFPGRGPAWIRREGDARARRTSLYLFCETDLPYEPDPQRAYPDAEGRKMCRKYWQEIVEELQIGYVLIRGTGEERLVSAIKAVEALLLKN